MLIPLCQKECRCGSTILSECETDSFVPTLSPRPQASITRQTRLSQASNSLQTSLRSVRRAGEKRGDFGKGGILYRGSRPSTASSSLAKHVHDGLLLYSITVIFDSTPCVMFCMVRPVVQCVTPRARMLQRIRIYLPKKNEVHAILGDKDKESFVWHINRRVEFLQIINTIEKIFSSSQHRLHG